MNKFRSHFKIITLLSSRNYSEIRMPKSVIQDTRVLTIDTVLLSRNGSRADDITKSEKSSDSTKDFSRGLVAQRLLGSKLVEIFFGGLSRT